jgi:hypothetical protein
MADMMPGTTLNGTLATAREGLLAAASKAEWIVTFETYHALAGLGLLYHACDDLILLRGLCARQLSDVCHFGVRAHGAQQSIVNQPVVEYDVGLVEQLSAPQGDQAGVSGPAATRYTVPGWIIGYPRIVL